jgi:hypothetical protein
MSSQQKINSARTNGAKSHGPKTEAGRKKSSMNAVKHGLYAESVVLSTESPKEYQEILAAYIQQFQPDGQAEFDLIEEMVAAKWRQRRLWAIESQLVELEMLDQKEQLDEEYTSYTEITQLASTYRALARSSTLPFLTRHESRLERAYSRALKNLLELQRLRKATQPAPPKNMQERTESQLRPTPTPAPAAQPPEVFPTTHTPQPTTGEAAGRAMLMTCVEANSASSLSPRLHPAR